MDEALLLEVVRQGLYLVLLLSAPPLLASMLAGLVMALLQSATRLHDPVLSLVPRVVAAALALAVAAPGIGEQLVRFSRLLWEGIGDV